MLEVSHIINFVYNSMTYILTEDGATDVWIVDCGDVDELANTIRVLKGDVFSIKGVLLTHGHYDHIYGLPKLTAMFPNLVVYTNAFGKKLLASERLNMSRYHDDPINYQTENVVECEEGDVIDLFDGVWANTPYSRSLSIVFDV